MVEMGSDMRQSTIGPIEGFCTGGSVRTRYNAFKVVREIRGFVQELEKNRTSAVIGWFQTMFRNIRGVPETINELSRRQARSAGGQDGLRAGVGPKSRHSSGIEIVGGVTRNKVADATGRASRSRILTTDGREWHRMRSLRCSASSWRPAVINGVGYSIQR